MRDLLTAVRSRILLLVSRVGQWAPVRVVRSRPVLSCGMALAAGVGIALIWGTTCGLTGCPSDTELRAFHPTEGGRVLDRTGALLGHLEPVRRINVPLRAIPRSVQLAFIAVEDRRFYRHHGIDWRGTARALWTNASHLEMREGSSTLTMQAARTAFLPDYEGERSLRRKVIEVALARKLEHALTKPQILELYLNSIYLGDDTYGVEAASRHYFGKSVSRLSLAEAATLAALPRAPSYYDPRRHPERAQARRDLVLGLMVQEKFIGAKAAERAQRDEVAVADDGWSPDVVPSDALDLVRTAVDSLVKTRTGRRGELIVRTTFDARAQRAAERAVQDRAAAIGRDVQGAMAAIDAETGELRAIVGSAVYRAGGLNRAVASRRQPGSAFKPFVYAAALEHGFTPATLVHDEPIEVTQGNRTWSPSNYGDTHMGTVSLRQALAHSLNAATVSVSQQVGMPNVVEMAHRAGVASMLRPLPSLALGSEVVTPLELVRGYAPFANGGFRVTPSYLVSISTSGSDMLWRRTEPVHARALDPRDAFLLTSMLQSVVNEGTGHAIRELGVDVPIAGKTGTTNDGTDVWFVGYTRTLVAGFWFGHDTPSSLGAGASGGRLAAPAWAAFYRRGWRESRDEEGWPAPDGVISVAVDARTGLRADGWCGQVLDEWFREGTEPRESCESRPMFEAPDAPEAPDPPDADDTPEPPRPFEQRRVRIAERRSPRDDLVALRMTGRQVQQLTERKVKQAIARAMATLREREGRADWRELVGALLGDGH